MATDLDGTLLPNGPWKSDEGVIAQFNEWTQRHDILVVYVTGRNLEFTESAIREYGIRYPDILCSDVGSCIRRYRNGQWELNEGWGAHVEKASPKWDTAAIGNALVGIDGLREQPLENQNRFKQSYSVDLDRKDEVFEQTFMRGLPSPRKMKDAIGG
uniref:Sucrose phosphatase-like domain-containing protein n=1 Tax=Candidatus Kentrum sp. MB TaxID=2138164 RepID=A0A451BCF4_9GAMM|nr:MAG: hypothetical protein BECKMB1821G_GA0114241_103539 [Candidatus Kentron sp. MB]VFK32497.1 MAG: hypothetical protein BECKMB1821I_GA0114274_10341 [Candidatus Kentron sp. MB]VFK75948.1 MAG: hypothetical protein BECKMB1821H_GA0114242_10371 [Candidatus Kentron sp. MB]